MRACTARKVWHFADWAFCQVGKFQSISKVVMLKFSNFYLFVRHSYKIVYEGSVSLLFLCYAYFYRLQNSLSCCDNLPGRLPGLGPGWVATIHPGHGPSSFSPFFKKIQSKGKNIQI